jgi:hypothetical protein
MNVLCYDPAYENRELHVMTIQEMNDLRFMRAGLAKREDLDSSMFRCDEALSDGGFHQRACAAAARAGESATPTYHLIQ